MAGLLDFLQSASNSAASNVSAPVDGLAWLLRKAGVPVGNQPMLGSAWMEQQGLTKPVPQSAMSLAGETAGLLAPIGIAAKAPQIAAWRNAVNELAESGAGRMPFASQRGAVVYHGSPHKFDKFDSSKIGTGEGAQAYGHGLYLAESPEVANSYATLLARPTVSANVGGRATTIEPGAPQGAEQFAMSFLNSAKGDTLKAIESVTASKGPMRYFGATPELADEVIAILRNRAITDVAEDAGRNLYKVDLPDEQIAKMLDYDSAVSEAQRVPLSQAALKQFGSGLSGTSGEKLYKEVVFEFKNAGHPNPTQAATDWLHSQGVPGIKYLDGGSRSAGSGTKNYVIFPKSEGLLSILERNGEPLK